MIMNIKTSFQKYIAASDKVYQLLAHGRWFSPASSTTKTCRHDIAEILLKVALNTNNQSINQKYIALFKRRLFTINVFIFYYKKTPGVFLFSISDQFLLTIS